METNAKTSKSPKKYIRKIGPKEDPEKYGLIVELGKGKYGTTYKAKNLNRQKDEDEFYAVKILHPPTKSDQKSRLKVEEDWIKETNCLKDVLVVCNQVDILCFKDSFIMNQKGDLEYVIITPLLDGYVTLWDYMYGKNSKTIDEEEAKKIYKRVVNVKNALTDLCINHSDLHTLNIMIHPDTKDIKVIDLGRCQTPQEEIEEWNPPSDEWDEYSDEGRLKELRKDLYESMGYDPDDEEFEDFEEMIMKHAPIKTYIPGCKRSSQTKQIFITDKEFYKNIKSFIDSIMREINPKRKATIFNKMLEYLLKHKINLDSELKNTILQKIIDFSKEDKDFEKFLPYYDLLK
jgi:hypothetical protein